MPVHQFLLFVYQFICFKMECMFANKNRYCSDTVHKQNKPVQTIIIRNILYRGISSLELYLTPQNNSQYVTEIVKEGRAELQLVFCFKLQFKNKMKQKNTS